MISGPWTDAITISSIMCFMSLSVFSEGLFPFFPASMTRTEVRGHSDKDSEYQLWNEITGRSAEYS